MLYSVSYRGACAAARHESCVIVAYPDGEFADGRIRYANGYGDNDPKWKAGDKTTPEEAWAAYLENLRERDKDLDRWIDSEILQHQYDALASAYYQAGSKIRGVIGLIDAGDEREAMALLATFNRKKDPKTKAMVFSRGLHQRRTMEINLYMKGDYADMVADTLKPAKLKFWEGDPNTTPFREVDFPPET